MTARVGIALRPCLVVGATALLSTLCACGGNDAESGADRVSSVQREAPGDAIPEPDSVPRNAQREVKAPGAQEGASKSRPRRNQGNPASISEGNLQATVRAPVDRPRHAGTGAGGGKGAKSKPKSSGASQPKPGKKPKPPAKGETTPTGSQEPTTYELARTVCSDPGLLAYAPEGIRDNPEALALLAKGYAPAGKEQEAHDGCLAGLHSIGL